MRSSYYRKVSRSFVSALALTFALHVSPAMAMDGKEKDTSESSDEDNSNIESGIQLVDVAEIVQLSRQLQEALQLNQQLISRHQQDQQLLQKVLQLQLQQQVIAEIHAEKMAQLPQQHQEVLQLRLQQQVIAENLEQIKLRLQQKIQKQLQQQIQLQQELANSHYALAQSYHYGCNGQEIDTEQAEKCYLISAKLGCASVDQQLAILYGDAAYLYHYGHNGEGVDIEEAKTFYQKAIDHGNIKSCDVLASLYHYGHNGQGVDIEKARQLYLLGVEKEDKDAYWGLGHLVATHDQDFEKASEYWRKNIESGSVLACYSCGSMGDYFYKAGTEYNVFSLHWHLKSFQLNNNDLFIKENLRTLLFPSELQEMSGHPTYMMQAVAALKKEQEKILLLLNLKNLIAFDETSIKKEKPWQEQDAGLWLSHLGAKMLWKYGEYMVEGSTTTNPRRAHKSEGLFFAENDYEGFGLTLSGAPICLQKIFDADAFIFMTPKAELTDHLLSVFNYSPLCAEEVGLRMHSLCGKTYLSFGNEAVQEADTLGFSLFSILHEERPYSLRSLVTRYQRKKDLLERLQMQKQERQALDEETLKLESCIIHKPERCIFFGGEGEPKPSFLSSLVFSLQKTMPEITEKGMLCYLEDRKMGALSSMSIEDILNEKIAEKVEYKIARVGEKIEFLQGIIQNVEEQLVASQRRRVVCFKLKHTFLEDMFD